jgi:hypothetical protein
MVARDAKVRIAVDAFAISGILRSPNAAARFLLSTSTGTSTSVRGSRS